MLTVANRCIDLQHSNTAAHLVSAGDHGVGQLPGHELIQYHAIGVDVRLETVGVVVLHAEHLWSLGHGHTGNTRDSQPKGLQVFTWIRLAGQLGYAPVSHSRAGQY